MDKKNTLLLTVVAIATLLVAVVGATFAYFASNVDRGEGAQFTANTAPMTSAFVASGAPFSLEVKADKMQSYDAEEGKVAAESTDGVITVSYASSVDGTAMYCTYDVFYEWTGTAYTAHSPINKPAEGEDPAAPFYGDDEQPGAEDPREFTLQATFESVPAEPVAEEGSEEPAAEENKLIDNVVAEEKDWTEFMGDGSERVKIGSARIWSNQTGDENKTVHTWTYVSRFYNVPAYQNGLAGKTFTGIFTVDNVEC